MAGSQGLVLITGINGYIASQTTKAFLDAGFHVRGTARNPEASRELLHEAFGKHLDDGTLEIVEVKDITVSGAFDEAVKGVNVIAHLASPVSLSFTEAEPVIHAATKGVSTVLESALKFARSDVKTAIILSSMAALAAKKDPPYTYTEKDWNESAIQAVKENGDSAGGGAIYQASKTMAEKIFWEFKEKNKPDWNFVSVNPAFVMGPPLNLPKEPSQLHDTVRGVWDALSGKTPEPLGGSGACVDVRDVARTVLFAAEHPEKANGRRLIAVTSPSSPQKTLDVLRKHYPERRDIIPVGNPGEGYLPDDRFPEGGLTIDASVVPELTGQKWISFEKCIVDAAKSFERYL